MSTNKLTYRKISKNKVIEHMLEQDYHHLTFDGKLSVFHLKDTDCFGIFDESSPCSTLKHKAMNLCGVILMVNRKEYSEPHIMLNEDKRGYNGLRVCRRFLKNKGLFYKLMIGRVPIERKDALTFSRLTGFVPFKKTGSHIFVGLKGEINNE